MSALWPWLAVAGLGAYHGLNPGMGWPFAVALGLENRSRSLILQLLLPIAAGHAASVATVAVLVAAAGIVIDLASMRMIAGCALLAFGLYRLLGGGQHGSATDLRAGFLGLAGWSFIMATMEGAGLMLAPALAPLCLSHGPLQALTASNSLAVAATATCLHTTAMVAGVGAMAFAAHGPARTLLARCSWLRLGHVWAAALLLTGVLLATGL